MTSVRRFPRARLGSVLPACTFTGSFAVRGTLSAARAPHFPPAHSSRAVWHRPAALHTLAGRTLAW